jgi:hypothetical protein
MVHECVWKGGKIVFEPMSADIEREKASVALILWSRDRATRPAISEFSFRLKNRKERYNRDQAMAAREVYRLLPRLDRARPERMTKTKHIYRDASRD